MIIRTAADLEGFRTLGPPPAIQAYVESLFAQLEEALGDREPDFSLDQHGFIVLLETGNDPSMASRNRC